MKKNIIFHNLGLKILAVITAIMMWLVVINISEPTVTQPISGIKVEVLNDNIITDEGKVYEILEGTDTVTASVTGKRTVLDYLTSSNIKATADMQELKEEQGTIKIRMEAANRYSSDIEAIRSKTENLLIKIENKKNRQFEIMPVVLGDVREGYIVGDIVMNQNVVYVSGAESVVEQISQVVAEVSVDGMKTNIKTNMSLKYYDADGNPIKSDKLSTNINNVDISIEILPTKEVPIVAEVVGEVTYGYEMTGNVEIDPQTITVAAKASVLNSLDKITIPSSEFDVEDAQETINKPVDLSYYLPEGVSFADTDFSGKIIVSIEVEKQEIKTVEIPKNKIAITNVPDGYTAVFGTASDNITFDVLGLATELEKLDMAEIKAEVDVKAYMEENEIVALKNTSYLMPVTITLPNDVTQRLTVSINIRINKE